jgi:hypothetical protein
MPRLTRTFSLLLTLSLFLASCLSPQGGVPQTTPSPTLTLSPSPAVPLTITPTPAPPSLESLGLSPETQTLLDRQGWQIKWDSQTSRYLISQLAWDETSQSFTDQPTHKIGYIDTEGNLHTKVTRFSATENPDGTWTDTSTTQDLVIPQLRPNASTPQPETWNLPTWNLIETKNPAFEKTGILTLTYLDENGAPQTITFNRNLQTAIDTHLSSFSRTDETFEGTPTFIPWEAIHSSAPLHVQLAIINGFDQPYPPKSEDAVITPVDTLDGYTLLFFGLPNRQTPIPAFAMFSYRPSLNGGGPMFSPDYAPIRIARDEKKNTPLFITFAPTPDGGKTPVVGTFLQIYNPSEIADKSKRQPDETLLISVIYGDLSLNPQLLRNLPAYIKHGEKTGSFMKVVLATQGKFFEWFTSPQADSYFSAISPTNNPANPNFGLYQVKRWRQNLQDFFGPDLSKIGLASLDSLLGMERNDVRKMEQVKRHAHLPSALTYLDQLSSSNTLLETQAYNVPLAPTLQQFVFVISP